MARPKYDGVVEAVHYGSDGRIAWARVYERRRSTFSDLVLIDRAELIRRLKLGKRFVVGKRVPYLSSTFEVGKSLTLVLQDGVEHLTTGETGTSQVELEGIPVV